MASNQTCISSEENLKNHLQDEFFYLFFNINKSNSLQHHYKCFDEFLQTTTHYIQHQQTYHYYINLYIRLIAFTRDIYYGLGHRDLSYLLLIALDKYCPQHTTLILNSFWYPHTKFINNRIDLPYSSWCDIKYLSKFILNTTYMNSNRKNHILNHIIESTNSQLNIDSMVLINKFPLIYHNIPISPNQQCSTAKYYVSNVSKWIPNQKNNNKILFQKFSNHWHANYDPYNPQHSSKKYRNVIKSLRNVNYYNNYQNIHPPPQSLFTNYLSSKTILSPLKFIKHIKKFLLSNDPQLLESVINDTEKHWLNYLSNFNYINLYCIPVLDLSISNNTDFIDNSIAISCFLSNFNLFGKKILVASEIPFIIDLSQSKTLFHSIQKIYSIINNGIHTKSFNIDKSISLINDAFINTKPTSENIKIVIFINNENNILNHNPFESSKYKPTQPTILYWNLSNKFIDKEYIENIDYEYNFINSNIIHNSTAKLFNINYNDSNIHNYFHFLFHKRYQYLSYFY